MWVKICGNTNVRDAVLAAESGADAVGFVFAPSVRQVTVAQVREIVTELPAGLERVGVFGGASADKIVAAVEAAGLTAVQLHGGVDLRLAGELQERLGGGVAVIHTVAWRVDGGEGSAPQVAVELATLGSGERVLVDAKVGGASGGLGVSFDWAAARRVLDSRPGLRVIVAGGLTPGNVREAIRVLEPWGVDVVSGVEASPGKKDGEKIRIFIENARRA